MDRVERLQEILELASEVPPDQVASLLDHECAEDASLRREVESLLRSLNKVGKFMSSPTTGEQGFAPDVARVDEGPGSRIGPYKLLQLIGEGGFGSIFMAEQEQPVRRKVALKIIKLGMDTQQVVARFEQERQALALMDHSHIAKVLDAGATDSGRPYFVMELVNGEPIVAYCDRNGLSIRERLELFGQVCSAVQHAHTKGVIHRDIKPSNVLVSTQDGRPHAKVIDFGIAKATSARLTERTVFTEHRQLIGTPQYMSPEQAERSVDIDTRTDVYSLGVLLYELLTGSTPFDAKALRAAAFAEMERIIREVEPPRPSTRLSQNSDSISTVAASRGTEPAKLGALVRGELDWVVMKAMEKDRGRRYESPSSLEADIRRYLNKEAVIAAPPGGAYRFRKFLLRNKGPVGTVLAVMVALMVGVLAFAWQAREAMRQRDAADVARNEARQRADELQQVSDFQGKMLGQVDATRAGQLLWQDIRARLEKALAAVDPPVGDLGARTGAFAKELEAINATDTAAAMIDRTILKPSLEEIDKKFKNQPAIEATLRQSLAHVYQALGLYNQALSLAMAAAEGFERVHKGDHGNVIGARSLQAILLLNLGRVDEGLPIARAMLESSTRLHGVDHEETLVMKMSVGDMLRTQQKFDEAEPLLKEAMDGMRRVLGNTHRNTLISLNTYGYLLIARGKPSDAEPYWQEAYESGRTAFGSDDPDVLIWGANLGGLTLELGEYEKSAAVFRDSVAAFRRVRGEEHPYTLGCLWMLSESLIRWGGAGHLAEAEKLLIELLEARRRMLGREHPNTLATHVGLGAVLHDQRKLAESEATLREGLEISVASHGREKAITIDFLKALALTLSDAKKYDESNTLYAECLGLMERSLGVEHFSYLHVAEAYAYSLIEQGGATRLAEAETILRRTVETLQRVGGPTHPETIEAILTLGTALKNQGKLEEAEQLILQAYGEQRSSRAGDHSEVALAMSMLGDLRLRQGRAQEAEKLLMDALDMRVRLYGTDEPAVASSRAALEACRAAMKK